jgi:hypothetical protein
MPEAQDMKLARAETVAMLRRMADLIESSQDGDNWYVTFREIQRLRRRAAALRDELAATVDGEPAR